MSCSVEIFVGIMACFGNNNVHVVHASMRNGKICLASYAMLFFLLRNTVPTQLTYR
jgi:hypothetical protein